MNRVEQIEYTVNVRVNETKVHCNYMTKMIKGNSTVTHIYFYIIYENQFMCTIKHNADQPSNNHLTDLSL